MIRRSSGKVIHKQSLSYGIVVGRYSKDYIVGLSTARTAQSGIRLTTANSIDATRSMISRLSCATSFEFENVKGFA